MKTTFKLFAFVIVLSFYTTGCYTIVWDPREEFPDNENSYESNSSDFYDYDYYGGYVDYYEAPWWIQPVVHRTIPMEPIQSFKQKTQITEEVLNNRINQKQ